MNLPQTMNLFLETVQKTSTYRTRTKHLRLLYKWLYWKGLTDLTASEADMKAYRDYLTLVRKLKPSTIASYFQTVKQYFGWLKDKGIISSNPAIGIVAKRRNIVRVNLTSTQLQDLANQHYTKFISFVLMVYSGLTPEEVADISVKDLHLKAPAWISLAEDTSLSINPVLLPMLTNYIKRDQPVMYLFHDKNNDKLPAEHFRKIRREGMKSIKD